MIPTSTLRDGDSSLLCLNNLDEAKEKFLSDPDCNFDGAILMHSGYSYAPSWGFYCCSPDAVQGSNRNWNLYQLSKLSPIDEENEEEGCPVGYLGIPENMGGTGKLWAQPHPSASRSIEDCADICNNRDGCTGFEFSMGPSERGACGTYTGGDSNVKDNENRLDSGSNWKSCLKDEYEYDYSEEFEEEENSWISLGHGGCDTGRIKKVGPANNLDEAKEKFLSDPDCNFDGAILMHSGYSYAPSWGFYCCSPDAVQGSNRNWNLYQLSKLISTDEQNEEEVCSNVRVTVSGSTVLTQFSGNYVSSSVTEKDELPVRKNDKGMSLWHDDETWVITPPESSSLGIFVEVSGSPGTMPSNGLWTGELVKNEADYRDVDVKFECLDSDPENNCVSVDTPFNGIYYETDKMRNGLPVYVEDTHGYELFHDEEVW